MRIVRRKLWLVGPLLVIGIGLFSAYKIGSILVHGNFASLRQYEWQRTSLSDNVILSVLLCIAMVLVIKGACWGIRRRRKVLSRQ